MRGHKWIKNINLWEQSIIETVKTLSKLHQFQDIKEFLEKIEDVITKEF